MATLLSVNVGMPKDVSWRGRTVHTGVWKSPVDRAADGAPPQHRRRRAGRPRRARRGAARRARLPDRVLPALAGVLRTRRPRARRVRGELHRRGSRRRRGLHRRPLPDRRGGVRGHPAAGDLLPGGDADGGAAAAVAAGRPPPPRVLPARADRGPRQRRRRDRAYGARAARAERGRRRRAALPARARPRAAEGGPGHPRPEPGLARVVPEHAGERDGAAQPGRRRGRAAAGVGRASAP